MPIFSYNIIFFTHYIREEFMRKYFIIILFLFIIGLNVIPKPSIVLANDNLVYLGGMPAGFSLNTKGAKIMGITDVISNKGAISPARESKIEIGDVILKIDGKDVNTALDVEDAVKDDKIKNLLIERNNETFSVLIKPVKDINGKYKIGVYIRDTVKGIGTITFVKNNRFASLGHPINDDCGEIANIVNGELFDCYITGSIKGERGKPGELKGIFTKTMHVGEIENNIEQGVYGKINENFSFSDLRQIEIGNATLGNATIYSTILGKTPKEYSIQISKVDNDLEGNKNLVIKINDKELLEQTGGIVQGMSGSPIVQNGRLVGAITHVFINDPTRGFGISINNMIDK